MSAIKLYDRVVLINDLPDGSFKAGDVGTVVDKYENLDQKDDFAVIQPPFLLDVVSEKMVKYPENHADAIAYEVEFFALDGTTLDVKTVSAEWVKPVSSNMVLHIREMTENYSPVP